MADTIEQQIDKETRLLRIQEQQHRVLAGTKLWLRGEWGPQMLLEEVRALVNLEREYEQRYWPKVGLYG